VSLRRDGRETYHAQHRHINTRKEKEKEKKEEGRRYPALDLIM
jgi:hypothetical protein